ncbi:MAG: tol-pal system protein YbgF [Pseudomonadales bacterium]|nr:tol-pal system protein YbgF [Pseudomonadales bacterium]
MQDLEDQIRQLRGQLEEQQHTLDLLRAQLKTQYANMDQRLSATDARVAQLVTAQAAANATTAAAPAGTAAPTATPNPDGSTPVDTEKAAYLAAYQVYRKQGPDAAIPQMLAFVHQYPQSVFLPHADYWLGEFYLNQQTPDLKRATSYFQTVIQQFPKHSKASAALYNLAMIQDKQNKIKTARASLKTLLKQYPDSPEAKPAQSWLDNEAKHKKAKHAPDSHQQDPSFVKNVKKSLDDLNQDAPNP